MKLVITMSRRYGTGASKIARDLADKLQVPLYNKEYFEKVCQSIINMINETFDRVPLTDWYYTSTAAHVNFKNRTVVGGLFINMI